MNTIPFAIVYQGMLLKGYANPVITLQSSDPISLLVYIQGWRIGTLSYSNEQWSMDNPIDPEFIKDLGKHINYHLKSIKKGDAL